VTKPAAFIFRVRRWTRRRYQHKISVSGGIEMGSQNECDWYLVRTKPGKERWVRDQLRAVLPAVFLPLLKARAPRWGRMALSVAPLFPCYLFARFELPKNYFDVRYLPGVSGIVSAGRDPLAVPPAIVGEIQRRAVNDVVEIPDKPLSGGAKVVVVEGPFRGFEAIFERYLSGTERVAILLTAVESRGLRVVLPASAVTEQN